MGRKHRPLQASLTLCLLGALGPLAGCGSDGSSVDGAVEDASPVDGADGDASSVDGAVEDASSVDSADGDASSDARADVGTDSTGSTYELDLAHWETWRTPAALIAGNSYTIEFPLATNLAEQALSAEAPGEFVLALTRVVCPPDPEAWIGAGGVAPAQLREAAAVQVTEVTLELFPSFGDPFSPQQRAESTCLTLRSADGTWRAYSPSPEIADLGESLRLRFTVDGTAASAAAIFLPTAYVTRISYRVID